VKIDDAILWDGQNRFSQVLIAVYVENPIGRYGLHHLQIGFIMNLHNGRGGEMM
jgi:hypothetical protein